MGCLEEPSYSKSEKAKPQQLESNKTDTEKSDNGMSPVNKINITKNNTNEAKTKKKKGYKKILHKLARGFAERCRITAESFEKRKPREKHKKTVKIKNVVSAFANVLVPAATAVAVCFTVYGISLYDVNIKVKIDGEPFGIVENISDVENIVEAVEKEISAVTNVTYAFTHKISYELIPVKNPQFLTQDEIYGKIESLSESSVVDAYGLYIDGSFIGTSNEKEVINAALENLLYLNTNYTANEKVEFVNNIEITRQKCTKDVVMTQGEIEAILETAIIAGSQNYEVMIKDDAVPASALTLTENAPADANLTSAVAIALEEAEKSNSVPRSLPEVLQLNLAKKIYASTAPVNFGDVNASSNFLSGGTEIVLKKIREEAHTETIPFEIEYRKSDKYYVGTTKVFSEGENGIRKITDEVSYVEETEVERKTISEEIIKEPIKRIILEGSLEIPKPVPTGSFILPLKYKYITTLFGEDGHRGIDYIADGGAPIYASDGGTVAYAGQGIGPLASYGIYVEITHANGLSTIYAHMSETSVKTGQKVFQGEVIGKVGSTGNSTGNHLHFEIIKNGSLVNPTNYLK